MYRQLASKLVSTLVALAFLFTSAHADSIITGSKPFTFIPGTVISSSQVNANYDYIISQVNTNAAKNGVNSSITALLGLTTPIDPNVGGSPVYNGTTVGGTANAITVTATRPAISSFAYTAGNIITFVAGATNTDATTINVNALGTKDIFKQSTAGKGALIGGEIVSGNSVTLYYDGTQFIYINQPRNSFNLENFASGGTIDLGSVTSHMANMTGNTTVADLGSSATTVDPFYMIRIETGPVTFTASADIITPNGVDVFAASGDILHVLFLGGNNWYIFAQTRATPAAGIKSVQVFTASDTWTKPNNRITFILVISTGPGGGGATNATDNRQGGGGGAGGTCIELIGVSAITSETVTIGTGGTGGASGGNVGGNGSAATTFGAHHSAAAGGGGQTVTNVGAAGTCTGGSINISGGEGQGITAGITYASGNGGASFWGGGGGTVSGTTAGRNGLAFGSGGSGASDIGVAGGNGANGVVAVLEFGY
jgi:hypothetical protein